MIFEEKTIGSERIYEGKILNLRRDKVTVRNGESYREIVEHGGGIVIIGLTDEGRVPMVRQYRKAAERAVLEIPAGKLEKGEDPTEAAAREFREETGYTAGSVRYLLEGYSSIGYSTEILRFYLAEGLVPGETDFDDNEAIIVEEYTPEELYSMTMNGELIDQKTIVSALLARELVRGSAHL
ncbi:MAG: NUDIX hydrolase [Clostridiales Family XIII bacterium]|jgi:ADP-ribose pyrophosphatase|nr:NUDIX hydrolase [Clostridiales Family XIII bacterium]